MTQYPNWVIVTKPGDTLDDYRAPINSEPPKRRKRKKSRGLRCVYCRVRLNLNSRTRDHFIPRSKGGSGHANIVVACKTCNAIKADLVFATIEEARDFIKAARYA